MISPTINFRILLLAVLPATIISIVFFSYFIKQQIDDIEANIADKGNALARHLASASEYGLSSGNMVILSSLIESAFTKNDVVSITITNNQGDPLIQKPRNKPLSTSTPKGAHKRIFNQPIIQRTVDLNDFENTGANTPPMIGWIIVEVSNETARQKKQDAILHTLSITLLTLVSSIFLTLRISRYITESISSLSNTVSEIENGNLNDVHFNLKECIEDILIYSALSAHEKGIEISALYYDDTPKELFGTMDCIRQVLINLIGNAIKFSDAGTIMIRTMLESQKNEMVQIKISITDQRTRISEKDKTVLSSAFSQMGDSNTHQYDDIGLELNLAISKSLTEAMHGKTGVEIDEDKSTTFWFTFPCQSKDASKLIGKSADLPYANKSITLYDANELTRISLTHALQHLGFDVTECLNIENLCAPSETFSMPDICVLSINSHEATEAATQEFLEKHRNYAHSKILVIVSKSDPLTLKTLRNWGADACLSKPFRQTDLEEKLVTIFRSPKNFYKPKTRAMHQPKTFTRLDGLNILIAEDNAINATLIETILCNSGAIPHIVDNGKKAVTAFNREDKFDLILMDIHMPEMNGVDTARKIREIEPPSTRIAIIGLTAASQNRNGPLSQNPDFDEILEKPIAINILLSAITYWTQTHKPSRSHQYTNHKSTGDFGIDKNLSLTLNDMLLHELPETKKKLQTAFDSTNLDILHHEIHRLLGGMAYCNFPELYQLTRQYQVSLKTDKNTMSENFQKMIAEMEYLLTTRNP